MSTYIATVSWQRNDAGFSDNKYSRKHAWRFDGGVEVPASASPHIVPVPASDPSAVDPEEAFVASLSSCHMLFFLSIARERGFVVDRYVDEAEGVLAKGSTGKRVMTHVTLRPTVTFGGSKTPDAAALLAMHHEAHTECFLANSVRTQIACEPRIAGVENS